MASVIMMGVSAVVNALAFTGGNALFSMIDKNDAKVEAQRHNAAVEKLNREQVDYNIKRAKNQDWLNTRIREKQDATNEVYSTNKAFDMYKKLYGHSASLPYPNLQAPVRDYTPSDKQRWSEIAFVVLGTTAGVVAVQKYW